MESALLLLVDQHPRLAMSAVAPTGRVRAFGAPFDEVVLGQPGEVGFVDWIRSRPGHVLGVRIWLHREWLQLMAYVRQSHGVRVLSEGVFEVVFREGEADPELSCDQAFDETRAYIGGGNMLLLALSMAPLSELEVEDVRRLSGRAG
jgi:hypothetical protein